MGIKGSTLFRVIFILILLLSLVPFIGSTISVDEKPNERITVNQTYTSTGAIYIYSNGDFATYSTSGDGTQSNPYIISGYEFSNIDDIGLYISDTDAHFIIQNNVFKSISSDAISLDNVTNGIVEYNDISNYTYGGIDLYRVNDTIVQHNTISDSPGDGINIHYIDNVLIKNNEIYEVDWGISGFYFNNSQISGNIVHDILYDPMSLQDASNLIVNSNEIYHAEQSAIYFNTNDHVIVKDNYVHDTNSYGIYMRDTNVNYLIKNNTFVNVSDGIRMDPITTGTIMNNITIDTNYFKNASSGIVSFDATEMNINNNYFTNGLTSVGMYSTTGGEISNNTMFDTSGIYLSNSSNFEVLKNNLTKIIGEGIELRESNDTIIKNNYFGLSDTHGIYVRTNSYRPTIIDNKILYNSGSGIYLSGIYDADLINNFIAYNGEDGIFSYQSYYGYFNSNIMAHNNESGFRTNFSVGHNITNNALANNKLNGLYLYSSTSMSVSNSKILKNAGTGIKLWSGGESNFTLNKIYTNNLGVDMQSSDDNIFRYNIIHNSSSYAVQIDYASNNTRMIYNNLITGSSSTIPQVNNGGSYTNISYNYYSEFTSTDTDNDGIFDTAYEFDGTDGDIYPLVNPTMTIQNEILVEPVIISLLQYHDVNGVISVEWSPVLGSIPSDFLYNLIISPDNGSTWENLLTESSSNSFILNTSTYENGVYLLNIEAYTDTQSINTTLSIFINNSGIEDSDDSDDTDDSGGSGGSDPTDSDIDTTEDSSLVTTTSDDEDTGINLLSLPILPVILGFSILSLINIWKKKKSN